MVKKLKYHNLFFDYGLRYRHTVYNYPDLFPVENDVRLDYDLVRDSQFHLQLALTYRF